MNQDNQNMELTREEHDTLGQIQILQNRIEERLRSMPTFSEETKPSKTQLQQALTDPFGNAYHEALEAENATNVRSRLPKVFNRLLRKQYLVNRKLIGAIRHVTEGSVGNEESINKLQLEQDEALQKTQGLIHNLENRVVQLESLLDSQEESNTRLDRILSTLQGRVNALTAPVKIDIKTKKTISAASIDFGQFYSLFVDKFRGPEDLIQKRLSQHIPHAKIANVNTLDSAPFLAMDIGCGRGEWLKLLRNEELNALGVDTNREILDHCREQGLNVQEGDAFGALSERKNSSVSLLTAFHLIEHMDFPDQLRFIYEAHRVLRPGGILIAETPNVGNVDVGASGFYHDPTHIRPVPWPLAKFMAEYTGFAEAEIRFLNPDSPDESSDKGETNVEWRERFHGPRDYALIARK